jgi:hypothetical protein
MIEKRKLLIKGGLGIQKWNDSNKIYFRSRLQSIDAAVNFKEVGDEVFQNHNNKVRTFGNETFDTRPNYKIRHIYRN